MNTSTKAAICAMALFACLAAMLVPAAWADSGVFGEGDARTETSHDTAGNMLVSGTNVTVSHDVNRDLMAFANIVNVGQVTIGGDIVAAGQRIDVGKANVAGNVRAAGSDVHVNGAQAAGNITVAGRSVSIGEGSDASAVYAAAADVSFSGSAKYAALTGNRVNINGTVDGDVYVSAGSVTVGEDAHITGTLTVVGAQPNIADGAQVNALDVQLASQGSDNVVLSSVLSAFVMLLTMLATTIVIFWLAPRVPQDSLFMLQARTVPMLITGVLALLAAPVVVALLLALGIGSLLAIVLLCLIVALAVLGLPFMSAAIAQRLIRNSKTWLVAVMAAAIAGLIYCVPFLNVVGIICGGVYIAGYVLQLLFLKLKARDAQSSQQ